MVTLFGFFGVVVLPFLWTRLLVLGVEFDLRCFAVGYCIQVCCWDVV